MSISSMAGALTARTGKATGFGVAAAILALPILVGAAAAQTGSYEPAAEDERVTLAPIGLRLGYTNWEGLEQIHLGAHMLLGEVVENVDFTPSFEVGWGGDLTLIAVNGDLTYRFTEMVSAPWGMYGGGSLALLHLNPDGSGSDTDLGLSAVGGFTREFDTGHQGMLEVRVGMLDSPGFKLTFGYTLF